MTSRLCCGLGASGGHNQRTDTAHVYIHNGPGGGEEQPQPVRREPPALMDGTTNVVPLRKRAGLLVALIIAVLQMLSATTALADETFVDR
jgi:hypothetical protein